MAERRMLREAMRIHDIYNHAEPIMELLRAQYGSYDGDSLDEVLIDASFAQLLKERGYDVQTWADNATEGEQPATPAPPVVPPVRRAPVSSTAGTTRARTGTSSSAATTGEGTEARTSTATSRTRRTTRASDTEEAPRTPRRTTRTAADETETSGT